jgi:predicted phage-related endonuclease
MSVIEMSNTAKEYREIMAEIKEMEAFAETLKQSMIKEMDSRQVDSLAAGEYTIHYTLVESNRLDSSKLKAEHGDLYSAYSKKTVSTRFSVA